MTVKTFKMLQKIYISQMLLIWTLLKQIMKTKCIKVVSTKKILSRTKILNCDKKYCLSIAPFSILELYLWLWKTTTGKNYIWKSKLYFKLWWYFTI